MLTFVDRIEVGEKVFPEGVIRNTHLNQPFTQEIKIKYKFINDILTGYQKEFPVNSEVCEVLEDDLGHQHDVDVILKQKIENLGFKPKKVV